MTNLKKLTTWDYTHFQALDSTGKCLTLSEQDIYLLGQSLRQMRWKTRWENGLPGDLDSVVSMLEYRLSRLQPCEFPEQAECVFYSALDALFTYSPAPPGQTPAGYDRPAWSVWQFEPPAIFNDLLSRIGGSIDNVIGLQPGDVYNAFYDFPLPETGLIGISPVDWVNQIVDYFRTVLSSGLPRISFQVSGTGQIELQFLPVPAGGAALVGVDVGTNIIDLAIDFIAGSIGLQDINASIDLNRDITQVPPEDGGVIVHEIDIETGGIHEIDIVFIPTFELGDLTSFAAYGGGFRGANLCGFDPVVPVAPENNMPFSMRWNNCNLEYELLNPDGTVYQAYTPVANAASLAPCFAGAEGPPGTCNCQTVSIVNGRIQIDNDGDGIPDEIYQPPSNQPNQVTAPTGQTDDQKCNSAYYAATQIIDFATATINDAANITLAEFLTAAFGLGGFDGNLLNNLWDYAVANLSGLSNTNLYTHRERLTEELYCNDLDRSLVDLSDVAQPDQGALVGAMNAVTDGKFFLWALVGQSETSPLDCATFICPGCGTIEETLITLNVAEPQDSRLASTATGNLLPSGYREFRVGEGYTFTQPGQCFSGIRAFFAAYSNSTSQTVELFVDNVSVAVQTFDVPGTPQQITINFPTTIGDVLELRHTANAGDDTLLMQNASILVKPS